MDVGGGEELGVASVGGVGGEFLEHGRELAEDLEVEGAVRGGGGVRDGVRGVRGGGWRLGR